MLRAACACSAPAASAVPARPGAPSWASRPPRALACTHALAASARTPCSACKQADRQAERAPPYRLLLLIVLIDTQAHFCSSSSQGDLQRLQLAGRLPQPDVVVVDPARPGLSPLVIDYLRGCGARRVVYVSCNAATQARDIRALCTSTGGGGSGDGGAPFRLVSVQAVDLYPQTHHVETIAVLDAVAAA